MKISPACQLTILKQANEMSRPKRAVPCGDALPRRLIRPCMFLRCGMFCRSFFKRTARRTSPEQGAQRDVTSKFSQVCEFQCEVFGAEIMKNRLSIFQRRADQ